MIQWYHIYALLKLSEMRVVLIVFFSVLTLASLCLVLHGVYKDYDSYARENKIIHPVSWRRIILTLAAMTLVVMAILLPNTKQAAIIYVVPKVLNSEFVQNDLTGDMKDLYTTAKDWMKIQIQDYTEQGKIDQRRKLRLIEKVLNDEKITSDDYR